jgi:phage portal protein BeeE
MSLISQNLQRKDALPARVPLNLSPDAQRFQLIGGRLITYTDNRESYLTNGYDINDIVFSIIDTIQEKCIVAPWSVCEIADESAYKQLRAAMQRKQWTGKDYLDAVKLQRKALVPAKNPGKWADLLLYPNKVDTWADYIRASIGYKLLMGNAFTYAKILDMGANKGIPHELHALPAQWVNIHATDTFPANITGYSINHWPLINYKPEEIMHQKNWNPHFEVNGAQLYGMSPLKAALHLLNRNNSSVQASAAAFQNEGIKALVSFKVKPGEVESIDNAVEAAGDMLRTQWSGVKNRARLGIIGYDVDVHQLGLTAQEMQIIESEKWDLRRLCSLYGVQSQILNDPDNKTYANQKEAEKALTARAALPRLVRERDALNRKAHEHWGLDKKYVLDFDLSVYGELQAEAKEVAEWTSKLVAIIPNEQREQCGLAAIDDALFNEPWVQANGRVPQSEMQASEVDDALNDMGDEDDDES